MNDLIKKCIAVCFLLLGLLGNNIIVAQPDTIKAPIVEIINFGDIGAIKLEPLQDPNDPYHPIECTTVNLGIRLANLDVTSPPAGPDGERALPNGYPDLYLEYTIGGGAVERVKLEIFYPSSNSFMVPVSIYEIQVESYPIDFASLCSQNGGKSFDLAYTLSLKTPLFNEANEIIGFIDYPATNYIDEGDIFSCLAFEEAGDCIAGLTNPKSDGDESEGAAVSRSQEALTDKSSYRKISCNSCGRADFNKGEDFSSEKDLLDVSVQPNPFTNNFILHSSEDTKVEQLSLYNSSGKLIRSLDQDQLNSSNRLNYNTDNLPKGLYFLKISTMDSSKTLKLIKQ